MGEISFQGESPFLMLPTQRPTATRSGEGVRLIVFASVHGKPPYAFEIQTPLSPDQARALAKDLNRAATEADESRKGR